MVCILFNMHIFICRNFSNIVENIKDWIRRYKIFLILELVCFVFMIILSVSLVVKNTSCVAFEKMTNANLYKFLICKKSFFDFFICSLFNFLLLLALNCLCFSNRYLKYLAVLINCIYVFKIFYDVALIICKLNFIGVIFSILCLILFCAVILCLVMILQLSLLEKLDSSCKDFNFCYDFQFLLWIFLCGSLIILLQCILILIFLPLLNIFV